MYELLPKVPINSLIHDLVFEISDLPGEVAEHYIRRSAIEIARRTNILRRNSRIVIQHNVRNYLVEALDPVDVVAILSVFGESECGCVTPVKRFNHPQRRTCCGGVSSWMEGNEIIFANAQCGDVFDILFSVSPRADACELDACFADEFYQVLLDNALALAYGVGDKPWTNLSRSRELKATLRDSIPQLNVQTLMGGQRGLLRVKRSKAV